MYLGTRDRQFNLSSSSAHQDAKFVNHTGQNTQPVVVGQRFQEALNDTSLVISAEVLLELRNDLTLVRGAERWGREKRSEFSVLLEDSGERLEGAGGGFESGGFRGGRVL